MCADWVNDGDIEYLSLKILYVNLVCLWFRSDIKHGVLGEKTNGFLLLQSVLYMYHFILSSDGEY